MVVEFSEYLSDVVPGGGGRGLGIPNCMKRPQRVATGYSDGRKPEQAETQSI